MTSTRERLVRNAARGELHHSLILYGPSPSVLMDAALDIARALNCGDGGSDSCVSCSRIDRGVHPDVHLISVGSERKMITVEQIRSIVSGATLRPFEGRCNVFIVEQADAMSPAGANALLKTLEEPPGASVFLLLTRSPELLLPTIRSRSQILPVRDDPRGSAERIASSEKVSVQVARVMAEHPSLSAADVSALVNLITDGVHEFAVQKDASALLSVAATVGSLEPPSESLAVLGETLRDLAALPQEQSVNARAVAAIRESIDSAVLLRAASLAVRASSRLVVNIDARLAAEQVMASLAQREP